MSKKYHFLVELMCGQNLPHGTGKSFNAGKIFDTKVGTLEKLALYIEKKGIVKKGK